MTNVLPLVARLDAVGDSEDTTGQNRRQGGRKSNQLRQREPIQRVDCFVRVHLSGGQHREEGEEVKWEVEKKAEERT